MSDYKKDEFGTRMKSFESAHEMFLDLNKPVCVRIDGKRFSKFTRKLEKPFDARMYTVMTNVAESLVDYFRADVGYTQSDEISLVFSTANSKNAPFSGRIQKLSSVIASKATSFLMYNVYQHLPKEYFDAVPCMDARVFNVPSDGEASNTILWRIQDSVKNGVSSAFRYNVGHKEMQNKNRYEMIEYMKSMGIDYKSKYQPYERTGTLFYKEYIDMINEETNTEYKRGVIKKMSGEDYAGMSFEDRVAIFPVCEKETV